MELIKQDTPANCGQACLAMVLGKPLEYVKLVMDRDCTEKTDVEGMPSMGVTMDEICWILYRHGVPYTQYIPAEAYPEGSFTRVEFSGLTCCKLSDLNRHIQNGGVAIIGVKSLNNEGRGHWLVSDGGRILDPSYLKTYESGQLMETDGAILIGKWKGGDGFRST